MFLLIALFFVTALLYASVGFGGGSTYNALLVLHGTDYRILPAIALLCNIIVVAGGVWRFHAAGHLKFNRMTPFVVTSIPFAWIGGRLAISEVAFVGLLGATLALAGLRMLTQGGAPAQDTPARQRPILAAFIGACLGMLSGMVGIGGGIFLAPVLHLMRWDSPRVIAGTCSFFILVNSISGLAGQTAKLGDMAMLGALTAYWALGTAVLLGGQIGSYLGSSHLSEPLLRRMTGVLTLYVACRLLLRWLHMIAG